MIALKFRTNPSSQLFHITGQNIKIYSIIQKI